MKLARPYSRFAPATILALAIVAGGCAPLQHTVKPYSVDSVAGAALSARAADACVRKRGPGELPPHPFTTDGCSLFPDGNWLDCCVEHDIAYWCGGCDEDRERADEALERCVDTHAPAMVGAAMHVGVALGGSPCTVFPWRWGYGFDEIRSYDCRRPAP